MSIGAWPNAATVDRGCGCTDPPSTTYFGDGGTPLGVVTQTGKVMTQDLFDTPILPGLQLADDFIDLTEETALIAAIDASDLTPFRFQGWLGKRLTRSFGWHYDFDNGRFAAAEQVPGWLDPLRRRAETFAGLDAGELVQALVIRYDVGAGIGWHRDRPHFAHVVGVSLGHPAVLRFRRRRDDRFERKSVPLAPRSIYHLSGEARHDWEHSIADMAAPRWSVTFRSLSDKGRLLSGIAPPSKDMEKDGRISHMKS